MHAHTNSHVNIYIYTHIHSWILPLFGNCIICTEMLNYVIICCILGLFVFITNIFKVPVSPSRFCCQRWIFFILKIYRMFHFLLAPDFLSRLR